MSVTAVWIGVGAAAGLVAGVGIGVVATGDGAEPATQSVLVQPVEVRVDVHTCPDDGVVGELRGGDRIVATAVDASGDWLEIRDPNDVNDRVWVHSAAIVPDDSFDDLPVATCPVAH